MHMLCPPSAGHCPMEPLVREHGVVMHRLIIMQQVEACFLQFGKSKITFRFFPVSVTGYRMEHSKHKSLLSFLQLRLALN